MLQLGDTLNHSPCPSVPKGSAIASCVVGDPAQNLGSVKKACRILSEMSDPGPHRLSNIVANTGLNKATVLRILDSLIEEGFIARDPLDKTYSLGNEALVMASVTTRRRSGSVAIG